MKRSSSGAHQMAGRRVHVLNAGGDQPASLAYDVYRLPGEEGAEPEAPPRPVQLHPEQEQQVTVLTDAQLVDRAVRFVDGWLFRGGRQPPRRTSPELLPVTGAPVLRAGVICRSPCLSARPAKRQVTDPTRQPLS